MILGRLHHQSGIALGPILFLLAIIAIIAAAISIGSSGFNVSTVNEGAKVNASTIIQTGAALQDAVRTVVVGNSCSPTQVNFANPVVSGYTNPNAPSDGSCDVFGPNGGNMSFPMAVASTLETADGAHWVIEGRIRLVGLGTCGIGAASAYGTGEYECISGGLPDLIAFLPIDSLATCQSINNEIGLSGYLGFDWYINPSNTPTTRFNGTYGGGNDMVDDGGNWPPGQMMGCLQQGTGGVTPHHTTADYPFYSPYFFYVVLLIN
jgi:hypothetical protein